MALLHPIFNNEGQHLGWARSAVDASSFFGNYGNLRDLDSEYFSVIDREGTILVHPMTKLEGKNYFGSEASEFLPADEQRDLLVQKVIAGQDAATGILYPGAEGERIITGYPIHTDDEPPYFLFLITPTFSIYSEINEVLFTTRFQNSLLMAAIICALAALAVTIIRWNLSIAKCRTKLLSWIKATKPSRRQSRI